MKSSNSIGNLMHLYVDEIESKLGTTAPAFLIKASANLLAQKGGRNWIPVIVKETGEDKYEVIGNSFIYAVATEANLERVWCIIADDSEDTTTVSKVLAGEEVPKINLSTASRDEISAALQYLIEQPNSVLKKDVKLAIATTRIDESPRQSWKNFDAIVNLKCGITKGKKLDAIKSVFYLTPTVLELDTIPQNTDTSELTNDLASLKKMTVTALRAMAKSKGITGMSKANKDTLIGLLSQ